jgi:hypothetical protein
MSAPDEEVRAWAKRCAVAVRTSPLALSLSTPLPEVAVWDQIAERGHEYELARRKSGQVYHGVPLMTPRKCFANTARTIAGLTTFDPSGCRYAEGFALGYGGLWYHHAWVVSASGLVTERTWREPGTCYVGVTLSEFPRQLGCCQLSDWPLGIAMGPGLAGEYGPGK